MWYFHAARDVACGGPCSDGGDEDRDRGGTRAGPALRAFPGRAAVGARMGGARVLPRPGPGGVRATRLAVEGAVRQPDRAAASRAGLLAGLGARALHHGRTFLAR